MPDEWDEVGAGSAPSVDEAPPAFLTPGHKRSTDEWDSEPDHDEPISTKKFSGDFGAELRGIEDDKAKNKAVLDRTLADRARDTAAGIKDTVVGGAKAIGGALPESLGGRGFLNTIEDPAHRREFERGLSDMITLGYAEKAGNAVSNLLDKPDNNLEANASSDRENAPYDRSLGRAVGMASPGAGTYIAKTAGKVVGPVLGDLTATTRAGSAALGAAKGVAGYEAAAPVTAALSAGAEGHRLDAAADAITDPVGLATSALGGALSEPVARNLVDNAKSRATKDIARDIVSAEGHKAKATDQMRIAEVNDRIFQMTKDNPELRQVWREPAEKALPQIEAVKSKIVEPLDAHYQALDEHTGGGITLGEIVDGYRSKAAELAKKRNTLEDADRLNALANQELRAAAARQGQKLEFDPTLKINADGTTAGETLAMFEKSAAAAKRSGNEAAVAQLQEEANKVREMASKPATIDMGEKIPTKDFRENVTSLHKTADSVMGTIEGTPRHEALQRLYEEGKQILDKHIDASGLDKSSIDSLRKINDQYFLLSRAEEAIKSRGIKESNRPALHSLIHSPRKALEYGVLPAFAAGVMRPHAIPEMATAAAIGLAAPAVASRVNWKLANIDPVVAQDVVRSVGTRIGSAEARVIGPDIARQQNDRALAQLIQGAQAGGDPDELTKRAAAFGISPVVAQQVIRKWAPQPTQEVSP
jgi:hypothetical protein